MGELRHNDEDINKKDDELVDSLLEEIKKDEKEDKDKKLTENSEEEKKEVKDIKKCDCNKCACGDKHGIFYWMLVVIGVAFIMYMSINIGKKIATVIEGNTSNHTSSSENKKEEKKVTKKYDYKTFLNQRSYLSDTSSWDTKAMDYYLYDINKDGVDELFVVSFDNGSNFFYTAIYTYVDEQVVLVDNIYTYGRVYGDNEDGGIVYALFRTTAVQNYYVLYKLNGQTLEVDDSVSFETGDTRIVVIEPTRLP